MADFKQAYEEREKLVRRISKAREQLAVDEARLMALNEEIVQMNKEFGERQESRRAFLEKPLN